MILARQLELLTTVLYYVTLTKRLGIADLEKHWLNRY
jgi:hypothetical protein